MCARHCWGLDHNVGATERPEFTALGSGTRQQRARAAARLITGIHQRNAGVLLALRQAAASDRELARLLRETEQRRRNDVEQGLSLSTGRAVTPEECDGLWAVFAVEVYQLLTGLRGWTPHQYETWLATRWWGWILTRINPSHIDRSAGLTEDLRRIGVIAAAGAPAAAATGPCPRRTGRSFSRP
jgi:hypothetical protein